jgi:hypothetical protein
MPVNSLHSMKSRCPSLHFIKIRRQNREHRVRSGSFTQPPAAPGRAFNRSSATPSDAISLPSDRPPSSCTINPTATSQVPTPGIPPLRWHNFGADGETWPGPRKTWKCAAQAEDIQMPRSDFKPQDCMKPIRCRSANLREVFQKCENGHKARKNSSTA